MGDVVKQKIFVDACAKEARLRLRWFKKNEDRLVADTEKPKSRIVPPEVLEKMTNDRKESFQNANRQFIRKVGDLPPPVVDPAAIYNIMKPVDAATKKMLYTGTQKECRKNYIHERVKIIPENKYYFPETSGFVYGWNMWNSSKTATTVHYGRCQVIKASFYRRNGVARDPDWYQEPAISTPTVCGCM